MFTICTNSCRTFVLWHIYIQAKWQTDFDAVIGSPLVWFDVELDVADDIDFRDQSHAYALNLTTMGKGTAWMNGNLLGECV